jgi:hypothetical protein
MRNSAHLAAMKGQILPTAPKTYLTYNMNLWNTIEKIESFINLFKKKKKMKEDLSERNKRHVEFISNRLSELGLSRFQLANSVELQKKLNKEFLNRSK